MDISEFILKMFTVGMFIAGMLGLIFQSATFSAQLRVHDDTRFTIDLAHAVLAAPCLVYDIDGEIRKGFFDSEKFSSAKNNFCLNSQKKFSLSISNMAGNELFSYGSVGSTGRSLEAPLPVLIKYPDKTIEGVLSVRVEK